MEFIATFLSFPVAVTAIPFSILFLLMMLSLATGMVDDLLPSFGGDADADIDLDLDSSVWLPVGIAKIPLVVSLTCITFIATIIVFYVDTLFIAGLDGLIYNFAAIAVIVVSLVVSLYISALLLRPLIPLFDRELAFARVDYIGMSGTIRSNVVTAEFGEAVITQDSLENQIDVYSSGNDPISYGDEVVILSYNDDLERYLVIKK